MNSAVREAKGKVSCAKPTGKIEHGEISALATGCMETVRCKMTIPPFESWVEHPLHCGRCSKAIAGNALVYDGGMYFHPTCYLQGKVQLGRATQISKNVQRMYALFAPLEEPHDCNAD